MSELIGGAGGGRLDGIAASASRLAPGFLATAIAGVAASLTADFLHAPAMLIALAAGMALNPLFAPRPTLTPGVMFSARTILRFGIVLLGARVTIGELADLGAPTLLLAAGGVATTIAGGWAIGRALGLKSDHAALSAGAVAICGASAALAISSVLPRNENSDRNTMLTIIGVTALSTVAMVLYPLIADAAGFDHRTAGVFLGASIHDVAQVVGAGFTISPETAETATIVKLMRVACLAPAVAVLGLCFRAPVDKAQRFQLPVPLFLLGFLAMMLLRSGGLVSEPFANVLTRVSQWCLLIAVVALGAKTAIRDVFAPGARPLVALVLQTALIGVFAFYGVELLLAR